MCTNLGYLGLWKDLDGKRLTPGQLQAHPCKLGGMTVQTSYVGGQQHQNWAHTSPQHLLMCVHGNWRKSEFFGETLCAWKFSTGTFFRYSSHGMLAHSGFRKYNRFGWPSLRFEVIAAQSEVIGKNQSCYEKSRGVTNQRHSANFRPIAGTLNQHGLIGHDIHNSRCLEPLLPLYDHIEIRRVVIRNWQY